MKTVMNKTLLIAVLISFMAPFTVLSQSTDPANTTGTKTEEAQPGKPAQPLPKPKTNQPRSVGAAATNDPSLNGQYRELLRRSWMQQNYRVVNPQRLDAFWKNVQDSIKAERNRNAPLRAQLNEQNKTISELEARTEASMQNLTKTEEVANQMHLLGIPVDKATYNTIMWGIVIVLAIALAGVIFAAGKSIREAKYRRQLFDEVSAEYQAHKIKANEKEKKLARELQTERNLVEELTNKNR